MDNQVLLDRLKLIKDEAESQAFSIKSLEKEFKSFINKIEDILNKKDCNTSLEIGKLIGEINIHKLDYSVFSYKAQRLTADLISDINKVINV